MRARLYPAAGVLHHDPSRLWRHLPPCGSDVTAERRTTPSGAQGRTFTRPTAPRRCIAYGAHDLYSYPPDRSWVRNCTFRAAMLAHTRRRLCTQCSRRTWQAHGCAPTWRARARSAIAHAAAAAPHQQRIHTAAPAAAAAEDGRYTGADSSQLPRFYTPDLPPAGAKKGTGQQRGACAHG